MPSPRSSSSFYKHSVKQAIAVVLCVQQKCRHTLSCGVVWGWGLATRGGCKGSLEGQPAYSAAAVVGLGRCRTHAVRSRIHSTFDEKKRVTKGDSRHKSIQPPPACAPPCSRSCCCCCSCSPPLAGCSRIAGASNPPTACAHSVHARQVACGESATAWREEAGGGWLRDLQKGDGGDKRAASLLPLQPASAAGGQTAAAPTGADKPAPQAKLLACNCACPGRGCCPHSQHRA